MKEESKRHIVLCQKIKGGDRAAFEALYRVYVQLIYNYGMKLCSRPALVEDSIQDLFAKLWLKRDHLKIDKSPKNYLLISFRRILFAKMDANKLVLVEEFGEIKEDFEEDSDKAISLKLEKVKFAVEKLPRRQKEVIHLRYFENFDYEEISGIMSLEVHSVYKLVSKAVKKLQQYFHFFIFF